MPTIWIVALVLLGLVALVFTAGMFVPRDHAVSVRARYARKPSEVWGAITAFADQPSWRPELESVERLPDVAGRPAWVEHSRHGAMPLEVVEWDEPRRMVARIADASGTLAFGGTWTWNLREVPGGCELTITENGFVRNLVFRLVAHYALGYTRTAEAYLRALGARFGEETVPKVV